MSRGSLTCVVVSACMATPAKDLQAVEKNKDKGGRVSGSGGSGRSDIL